GEALAQARELAAEIGRNAPLALAATKRIVVESTDWPQSESFDRQAEIAGPVFFSADAMEGAVAFAEKRAPVGRGEEPRTGVMACRLGRRADVMITSTGIAAAGFAGCAKLAPAAAEPTVGSMTGPTRGHCWGRRCAESPAAWHSPLRQTRTRRGSPAPWTG